MPQWDHEAEDMISINGHGRCGEIVSLPCTSKSSSPFGSVAFDRLQFSVRKPVLQMATTTSPIERLRTPSRAKASQFKEMFDQLKSLKEEKRATIQCAAKPRGVSPCKEIVGHLNDKMLQMVPNSVADVDFQLAVQLLEMMLCPLHHRKVYFSHLLLLDWHDATAQTNRRFREGLQGIVQSIEQDQMSSQARTIDRLSPEGSLHIRSFSASPSNRTPLSPEVRTDIGPSDDTAIIGASSGASPARTPGLSVPGAWNFDEGTDDLSQPSAMPLPTNDWPHKEYQQYLDLGGSPSETSSTMIDFNIVMDELRNKADLTCIAQSSNGSRCEVLISRRRVLEAKSVVRDDHLGERKSRAPKVGVIRNLLCSVHLRFEELYMASYQTSPNRFRRLERPRIPDSEPPADITRFEGTAVTQEQDTYTVVSEKIGSPSSPGIAVTPPVESDGRVFESTPDILDSRSARLDEELMRDEVYRVPDHVDSPLGLKGSQRAIDHSIHGISTPVSIESPAAASEGSFGSPITHGSSPVRPHLKNFGRRPSNHVEVTHHLKTTIRKPLPNTSLVYLLKSSKSYDSQELIKVGVSVNPNDRIKQLHKCTCGCDFGDIGELKSFTVTFPKKVESLVKVELFNFNCQRVTHVESNVKVMGHTEWFWVSSAVAEESIVRWTTFVNMAYTPEGDIKDVWGRHVRVNLPDASEEEKKAFLDVGDHDKHHRLRRHRLDTWLNEGPRIELQPQPTP